MQNIHRLVLITVNAKFKGIVIVYLARNLLVVKIVQKLVIVTTKSVIKNKTLFVIVTKFLILKN